VLDEAQREVVTLAIAAVTVVGDPHRRAPLFFLLKNVKSEIGKIFPILRLP
jgi:hypothetical protein